MGFYTGGLLSGGFCPGASYQGDFDLEPEKLVTSHKPPWQKPPDNKPHKIIEEIIAKYAVDANLFQLGSTNPKKKKLAHSFFWAFIPGAYCREFFVGGLLT